MLLRNFTHTNLFPFVYMKKKINLSLLLVLFLLVSCKSKKSVVAERVQPLPAVEAVLPEEKPAQSPLPEKPAEPLLEEKQNQAQSVTPKSRVQAAPSITRRVVEISSPHAGVERVVEYGFTHRDVPEAFEGFRIAFISDLHYKSLLQAEGLEQLVSLLNEQRPDVLLMGGDYQEGCEYVAPLFEALARVKTPMGTYGVMGNNDYERCYEDILRAMRRHGIRVLEHEVATLLRGNDKILVAGVRNPFDLRHNRVSPTLALSPEEFVILLVHTPDYVEQVSVANTDLALAGHTHGGQVRLFGIAPVQNSQYGNRFLTGLVYNTARVPMIVTNGIGTSQLPIRMGAPAEIVMITLHCAVR